MTDSQLASLSWCQASNWDEWPIFLSPWNFLYTVAGLLFCSALSDKRRVCNLLYNCFRALPEQSLLGQSPTELTAIFYCLVWDSQPGRSGPRIYIPQEQSGPVVPPGTGFPFCRLLRFAGLRWRYSNPPPHGKKDRSRLLCPLICKGPDMDWSLIVFPHFHCLLDGKTILWSWNRLSVLTITFSSCDKAALKGAFFLPAIPIG
jgi:hypothetical protein